MTPLDSLNLTDWEKPTDQLRLIDWGPDWGHVGVLMFCGDFETLVKLGAEQALQASNWMREAAWRIKGHRPDAPAYYATAQLLQEVANPKDRTTIGLMDLLKRVEEHLLSLCDVITDRCPTCSTPTCASCFTSCAVCGREFCGACLDRVCPEHEVSAEEGAALVREVLASEGFEDVGSDLVGWPDLQRVRDFSHGVHPARYKQVEP